MTRTNMVLLILAIVLAIPVGIHLAQEGERFTVWGDEPLLFEGLDPAAVEVVGYGEPTGQAPAEVGGAVPRTEIWFAKTAPGRWVLVEPKELAGAPVYADRVVGSFLDFVQPIRLREADIVVRDADEAQLDQYGLTRAGATVVSLQRADRDRTQLAMLYVGHYVSDKESGRGLGGYYVRDASNTTVLFYERDQWGPTTAPAFWLDTALHRIDENEIRSIRFTGPYTGGEAVGFARDEEKHGLWNATSAPDGVGAVRQGEVANMVIEYARASAERLVQRVDASVLGDLKYGLGQPYVRVEATMEDGTVHAMTIGSQVEGSAYRYALGGSGEWLYIVRPETFDRFARSPADTLFDPPGVPEGRPGTGGDGR